MQDVFISYSRADSARVRSLVDALVAARGWSVWWDTALRPGEQFPAQIEHAVERGALRRRRLVAALGDVPVGRRGGIGGLGTARPRAGDDRGVRAAAALPADAGRGPHALARPAERARIPRADRQHRARARDAACAGARRARRTGGARPRAPAPADDAQDRGRRRGAPRRRARRLALAHARGAPRGGRSRGAGRRAPPPGARARRGRAGSRLVVRAARELRAPRPARAREPARGRSLSQSAY